MAFRANKDGTWVGGNDQSEGTVVYGKSGDSWLYAKEVFANRSGTWYRAWTDCRKHDEGGRGWTASAGVTEYQNTCNNRQSRVRTDYTKTGCTGYSRYTSWVSSPDCNSSCFTASTSYYFTGTCQSRTQTERTTYTANAGSGCTTYYTDATPTASPTCGGNPPGACWTDVTCNYAGGSVTWDGVLFDVTDIGGGACYSQSRSNIFGCTGGQFELTRLYLCGSTQVYEGQCYSF